MGKIGIIDYGMGNLHSVKGALDHIGERSFVSRDAGELALADALILPGVGAFPDAMDCLCTSGLADFIKKEAEKKPLLGICLGMQLLFDRGYEFREREGLGLIGGEVVRLTAGDRSPMYKIPHMGWNSLDIKRPSRLLAGLDGVRFVYFVHSFKGVVDDPADLTSSTEYGEEITATVERGNVFGAQFHPEKSEETGLAILRNFGGLIRC